MKSRRSSPAQVAAQERYNAKAYDRIAFRVPKGERERLKTIAETEGKSVNQFITDAIRFYCDNHGITF